MLRSRSTSIRRRRLDRSRTRLPLRLSFRSDRATRLRNGQDQIARAAAPQHAAGPTHRRSLSPRLLRLRRERTATFHHRWQAPEPPSEALAPRRPWIGRSRILHAFTSALLSGASLRRGRRSHSSRAGSCGSLALIGDHAVVEPGAGRAAKDVQLANGRCAGQREWRLALTSARVSQAWCAVRWVRRRRGLRSVPRLGLLRADRAP